MEMERVTEFPHTHMDRRPAKRARLGWDVLPQAPKVFFSSRAIDLLDLYRFIDARAFFFARSRSGLIFLYYQCFVTDVPFSLARSAIGYIGFIFFSYLI